MVTDPSLPTPMLRRLFGGSAPPPVDAPAPELPAPPPPSPEAVLAEQLRAAREGLEQDRRRYAQALHDERRDAEKRLELAKAYAETVGLHRALKRLIEETSHWGSWLKRADAERFTVANKVFAGLRAASRTFPNVGDTNMLWVPMPTGVHRLRFSRQPSSPYSDGGDVGTVSWSVDGRPVFRGTMYQDLRHQSYQEGWNLLQVQRFEVGA